MITFRAYEHIDGETTALFLFDDEECVYANTRMDLVARLWGLNLLRDYHSDDLDVWFGSSGSEDDPDTIWQDFDTESHDLIADDRGVYTDEMGHLALWAFGARDDDPKGRGRIVSAFLGQNPTDADAILDAVDRCCPSYRGDPDMWAAAFGGMNTTMHARAAVLRALSADGIDLALQD